LAAILVAAASLTLAVPAGATPVPGENGRIVLTSARTTDNANLAELFLLPVPFLPGGPLSAPIATSATEQHRHATWSPDRTMIAYARGVPPNWDIYVQDLTQPGSTPVNLTNSPNVFDDRPAWSPNGEMIAYESEVTDGSGQKDILIRPAGGGAVTNFTNTGGGVHEGKPAWDPTSQTLFYEKGDAMAAVNVDIVRKPVAGGAETLAVADSGQSEFQPAISPDGSRICYTHSTGGFNATADVRVALVTDPPNLPAPGVVVSKDGAVGEYNCTWSPDSTQLAYVHGIFGTGMLVALAADGSDPIAFELAQDPGANSFDGNPDWAPDGRPDCPNTAVSTTVGTPITIPVACNDTGPAYEQSNVREFVTEAPLNGTTEQEFAGDPVTYTPNAGFVGVDNFEIRSFDEFGFGTDRGTVVITVTAPDDGGGGGEEATCGGQVVTMTGTAGDDVIQGDSGANVIAGLEGNDRIRGAGGNDILCGGSGNDRLLGGNGRDRLLGQKGRDRLNGGKGKDRCNGGPQRDVTANC
jgi:Tol biopolymer transport system component